MRSFRVIMALLAVGATLVSYPRCMLHDPTWATATSCQLALFERAISMANEPTSKVVPSAYSVIHSTVVHVVSLQGVISSSLKSQTLRLTRVIILSTVHDGAPEDRFVPSTSFLEFSQIYHAMVIQSHSPPTSPPTP
jgi:hypothetical protein